jgi:uncharacterized protein (TIGR02246 family)
VRTGPAAEAVGNDPAGEDRRAIGALVGTFIKGFDAGDATATAATYTETAVVVDEEGARVEGRAAIREQYAAFFKDKPGSKIAIEVGSLKFLGSETALEEGRATIRAAGAGSPEVTRFTTVYVKQGGKWLQAAVRDEPAHDLNPHDHLKALEWMLGEWVNESDDAMVFATCEWAKGGNFIDREFTMKVDGKPLLTGTQRIGWDPVKQQFKTWIFESDGGHGEGYLMHNGAQWVIKIEGIGRNGKHASATNIVTRLGKDRMSWQSAERTLGGAAIPGVDEFVVVRKPPEIGK